MCSSMTLGCSVFVILLNRTDRINVFDANRRIISNLSFFPAIEGNENDVLKEIRRLNLRYQFQGSRNYGALANALSKFNAFTYQLKHRIPRMLLFEDDVILKPDIVETACSTFMNSSTLILHWWGEGYRTDLNAARGLRKCFCIEGITMNVDNQIRRVCGKYVQVNLTSQRHRFLTGNVVAPVNKGHIRYTKKVNLKLLSLKTNRTLCMDE